MKLRSYLAAGLAGALTMSALTASADYATTLSGLGPIGYWRLNEPTQPAVPTYPMANSGTAGAALNGLYYGVPTLGQPGAMPGSTAANFSGNLQYAETPYNAALNPSGPFTVEFWANITNTSAGAKSGVVSRYITVAGGPTAQRGYLFFANNGNTTWQFRVYNGTAATTITDASIGVIAANTWYHVVGVYDGANITIYVNGLPTSTTTGTVVYAPNTNSPTRFGAGTPETAPSLFLPGLLDNVAIYHSVLTPSQIAAHYDAATTNAAGYNAQILADNPAVYYPLNESALPPYVPYAATNSGSLGSAQNGVYSLAGSTSGVAGPLRGQFAGFASDNKSVALNGTSGQIDIPGFATTTDTATIVGWIKRNGTQVGTSPLLFQRAAASPATGLVVNFTDRIAYSWNDDAATYNYNPGADFYIPDGVWTFAALTVTPTNATIYIGSTNGLKSATRTGTHAPHDFSGGPLAIGRDTGSTTRFVKGNLDEIAIFDQAFDAATISNLFYSATPAIPLVTVTPAAPYYEGMAISFTAYGVGNVPVTYQWRKGGVNLPGKTASTLVLGNTLTTDSGNYDVVVTGASLSVTSAVSSISVVAGPPIIAQQPAAATRYEGAAVTFSVAIQGSVPWSFQWKKGGTTAIPGATNSTYTIPAITAADAGSYSVTISNPLGSTNSAAAVLTVLPADNYAAQVSYNNAGAYWQMNEKAGTTAFDYIGGLNCTIAGATTNNVVSVRPPTYAGFSATNTCFAFAGNSVDYLTTSTTLNFTNTSITMAAWVMPYNGLLAVTSDVNFVGSVGSDFGLNSAGTDGKVRAHPLWGNDTGLTFAFDTWNYVVVVWTPSGQTFYLDNGDGNGLRTSSVSGTVNPSIWKSGPFFIGRQASRTDRGWPGQIDELALFDRALTPAEVTNLYLTAISGPTPPNIVTQPTSQTVLAGQPVSFTVGASGGAPLTYQWKHAGTNIPGATSKTLTIPSTYYTDAGSYQAVVANGLGSPVTSAAASLTVQAPATFANLTNGLVLHLKFDGNTQDSSGHGNNGVEMNLTTGVSYVPGKIGANAVLVGTNGYVEVLAAPDLAFGAADSFSVAFWVKNTGNNNDVPIIGNAVNSTYQDGWVFSQDGNQLEWTLTGFGDNSQVVADPVPGSPVVNDGVWHNVVACFNRDLAIAITYVDGAQVDSRSIAGLGSVDSTYSTVLGNDPTGGYIWDPVTYQIDDLGIWRRALTPGEATGIYAAGQVGQSFDVNGPASLTIKKSGANLEIIWQQGTLQSVDKLGDTWTNVPGAVAPYYMTPSTGDQKFFRVKF
ncbi:MAG: LamG-like jellyroll fold domain-containing protein [Verrucomicrobiota bacterium]